MEGQIGPISAIVAAKPSSSCFTCVVAKKLPSRYCVSFSPLATFGVPRMGTRIRPIIAVQITSWPTSYWRLRTSMMMNDLFGKRKAITVNQFAWLLGSAHGSLEGIRSVNR
jgi:hypothetical protein